MKRLLLLAALALSGCATTPPDPALTAAAEHQITCSAGPDCEAKWSRAVGWVAQNSSWKIQTQTNDLIQTYGPGSDGSVDLAYTVSKIARGDGNYMIQISTACANIFGCIPSDLNQRAAFARFVDPTP